MGILLVVALLLAGLVAAGVRVPGASLARAIAARILCAASLTDECGDQPSLIDAYGPEVAKLVREHMPTIFYEEGSRAVPVDYRLCRDTSCGDAPQRGLVHRADTGLPVSAFVHVIDCRPNRPQTEADCTGDRRGNLYLQYWLYYANSATLRPLIGKLGYHHDDWESVQIRIRHGGKADERASSHDGYNYEQGPENWGSDAGIGPLKDLAEAVGARPHDGWGPETHVLLVSGGSHAGNATGIPHFERLTLGRRVHLIPFEPIAAEEGGNSAHFAIVPPWLKRVWRDPEAEGTE